MPPKSFTVKDATGVSPRQRKVAEEVRHALVFALERGALRLENGESLPITVSEVRMSPDLKNALAFVLPLAGKDSAALLALLKKQSGSLRYALGQRLALKYTPALRFALDSSFDQASRIDALFRQPQVAQDLTNASL